MLLKNNPNALELLAMPEDRLRFRHPIYQLLRPELFLSVLHVRRPNRDYLLRVRAGEFEYEALVGQAEEKLACVRGAFQHSSLPDKPDRERVNELLAVIRHEF